MLHQYFVFVKIITYYNANINFSTKSHHQEEIQLRLLTQQIKLRIQVAIYSLIITKQCMRKAKVLRNQCITNWFLSKYAHCSVPFAESVKLARNKPYL